MVQKQAATTSSIRDYFRCAQCYVQILSRLQRSPGPRSRRCCTWFRSVVVSSSIQESVAQLRDIWTEPTCVDNLDTRMQRSRARPPFTNLLSSSQPVPTRRPPRRQPASELHHPGHRSHRAGQAATCQTSHNLRDGSPSLHRLSLCHIVGRKPQRSHQWPPVLGCAVPSSLLPALG